MVVEIVLLSFTLSILVCVCVCVFLGVCAATGVCVLVKCKFDCNYSISRSCIRLRQFPAKCNQFICHYPIVYQNSGRHPIIHAFATQFIHVVWLVCIFTLSLFSSWVRLLLLLMFFFLFPLVLLLVVDWLLNFLSKIHGVSQMFVKHLLSAPYFFTFINHHYYLFSFTSCFLLLFWVFFYGFYFSLCFKASFYWKYLFDYFYIPFCVSWRYVFFIVYFGRVCEIDEILFNCISGMVLYSNIRIWLEYGRLNFF